VFTSYDEARRYLTSRLDFEGQPLARPYSPTHYNLERFVRLLGKLGNPHHQVPSVHIAGSKGKGSVAVLLEGALRAVGYSVGTYTSPHLRDYTERFRLDGRDISREEFTATLSLIAPVVEADGAEGGDPAPYRTVFELLTAMAFTWFAEKRPDLVILETGLGGRLDCTNVVKPEVAVITALGLDHTSLLGSTLDRIAFEKGGIIKEKVPVVIGAQSDAARAEALPVLRDIAANLRAPVTLAEEEFDMECRTRTEAGQQLRLLRRRARAEQETATEKDSREGGMPEALEVRLPLTGGHQVENLRTAAAVWSVLCSRGWNLPWVAFAIGVEKVHWPGRMEIVPTRPRVVVDGAHCPLSARALKLALDELYPRQPRHMVFGAQRDKAIGDILRALAGGTGEENAKREGTGAGGTDVSPEKISNPASLVDDSGRKLDGDSDADPERLRRKGSLVTSWAFYAAPGARAATGEELAARAREAGIGQPVITVHRIASEALEAAISRARPEEIVVCCGTLYTIAEVLDRARKALSQ